MNVELTDLKQIDWLNHNQVAKEVLKLVPQQDPFRYLDEISELDEQHIVGHYTFKLDEWFYRGHFPGRPVTPGVILIEAMAQVSVVAQGIYLVMREQAAMEKPSDISKILTVFTDVTADFIKEVPPGERVTIKAERVFWRRRKLKSRASLYLQNGELAVTADLSGMGVAR